MDQIETGNDNNSDLTARLLSGEANQSTATMDTSHGTSVSSHGTSVSDNERSIQLRGSGIGKIVRTSYPDRIRGSIRIPEPRANGNRGYIGQLLRTCLPLAIVDIAVVCLAGCLCMLAGLDWVINDLTVSRWIIPTLLGYLLVNTVMGLYPGVRLGVVDELRRLSLSLTIIMLMLGVRIGLSSPIWQDRAIFLLTAYILCLIMAPIVRSRIRCILANTSWWGFPTIVCGNDAAAFNVCEWLSNNRRLGLRPLGVISDPDVLELDQETPWFLGNWESAREIAEQKQVFWSVLVDPPKQEIDVTSALENHLGIIPHVFVVSELTGLPDHWNRHQMDEGLDGFLVEQHLLLPIPQMIKRGMDLLIATIVALLLAPLFVALAIAIKLTSKGPVFYGHERVGKKNTSFHAWKFRTMVVGADKMIDDYLNEHPEYREEWERDHKLKHDPRVNALGKFMRKWSIDELPQVWNVLTGDMSIVGPRPIVIAEIAKYGEHYETLSTVLPGITGLWQVCGRNDTTYEERIQLDVYYIHHWSPWLDLYLLTKTVKTVLFTKGAY